MSSFCGESSQVPVCDENFGLSDCFGAAGDCLVEVIEAQRMWIAFVDWLCTINLWAF
jgi:hypothetical protein